ncbi:MAG: hypothetical protein JW953_09160 [Anaerolineae bacterium]|nr:hypothetical protein [Anaerolineae bacterium]
MPIAYLGYNLQNGYIHNWLVAGPQAIAVPDLDRFAGDDFKLQIDRHYHQADSGITQPPVEHTTFSIGDTELRWDYLSCRDDHFVDRSAFYHTCHYLQTWAYARVASTTTQDVTFILTTHGPADIWLNGRHIYRHEHFYHPMPRSVSVQTTLEDGHNEILVRFANVATRDCPYAMALQLVGITVDDDQDNVVFLPTANGDVARFQTLEQMFEAAYLDRDVYVWDDKIILRLPEDMPPPTTAAVRFQSPANRIYLESLKFGENKKTNETRLSQAYHFPEGPYRAVLMPHPKEFHEGNMRIHRDIPFYLMRNRYSQTLYGTYPERRREALEDAARREQNVFSEIAKMALGAWSQVRLDAILESIENINRRADCSDFYLAGLLGMLYRYGDDPSFPAKIREPLEACILNFKYWDDEPGSDVMWYWSENHQILFHTCEILAGQLFPDKTFPNANQTGQWHREKGERLALSWLQKRAKGGFQEWDSNVYFEEDLLALSHLVDLAENPQVYELAAVIMDKMFFTMAVNSYRGTFGSTHGRTYSPHIKGGRLESTAGISRLMWGMGVFNQHILGPVSLACAVNYELPPLIQQIATALPEEMWSRERHAGEFEEWCDRKTGSWEVNKVTYKTPDYMLCSAQDYRPGEEGSQQHLWQATMGPDAVVFVNHPAWVSEEGSHRPDFWHGNIILPRTAQWKDVLVSIHNLPEDDWLGFTHAYFPVFAFDEYVLRDGANGQKWAFARKDNGYLALTAAQGFELITRGDNAYRELRSYGLRNSWLCHMGRAALDGEFSDFQEKVLALTVTFDDLLVQCDTLRGETFAFGREGPLLLNGQEQPIKDFKHYENPYCVADLSAPQMEIAFGDKLMRLEMA